MMTVASIESLLAIAQDRHAAKRPEIDELGPEAVGLSCDSIRNSNGVALS